MNSMKIKFVVLLLVAGLLSACGTQAVEPTALVSLPTEEVAAATEAPTDAPAATDTSTPITEEPAATEVVPAGGGATVSFAIDVLPIIQSRCINCHGGDRTEEGLSMNSHAEIMTGSEHGAVVLPGDAANSLMAQLVIEQEMPKRGPKLTPPQVQVIVDWINQGALNN
jgi:uncharacterized membrane protein